MLSKGRGGAGQLWSGGSEQVRIRRNGASVAKRSDGGAPSGHRPDRTVLNKDGSDGQMLVRPGG